MILISEITIKASIDNVFNAVTCPAYWVGTHPQTVAVYLTPKSYDDVTSPEDLEPYPKGYRPHIGEKFYEVTQAGPVSSLWLWKCMTMEGHYFDKKPRTFSFKGESKRLRCHITYHMTKQTNEAIKFVRVMDITSKDWLTKLALPFFKASLQSAGDEYLTTIAARF